jgi:hypothetical protein
MSNELLLTVITALLIQCVILYLIIGAATKAERRARYDWAQTQFLAHIARQQGMPEEEIKKILDYL